MTTLVPAWVNGTLTPVDKLEVHQRGLRHLAVSVFVMDGGKTLIQRRALGKYHTPGLWANTCCTHPVWGEAPAACALRRLREELGITGLTLTHLGQTEYRAEVGQSLIEHELVEIFVAQASADLRLAPNPDEVMQTAWIDMADLKRQVQADPARFTPWLAIYLDKGWGELARLGAGAVVPDTIRQPDTATAGSDRVGDRVLSIQGRGQPAVQIGR